MSFTSFSRGRDVNTARQGAAGQETNCSHAVEFARTPDINVINLKEKKR